MHPLGLERPVGDVTKAGTSPACKMTECPEQEVDGLCDEIILTAVKDSPDLSLLIWFQIYFLIE